MASQSAPPPASSATAPQPPTTSQASPNPPTSVASLSTTAQFNTSTSQQTSATASPSSSSSEESALSANSLLPTQETSDQGSPSSAPPNSLLGSNNGNSGESKRSSGLGIGTIIAIVVGVLAAIGLISWVVLYQATKSKVNFQAPIHSGDLEKSSNMHYSGPMVNDNSAAIRDAYGSQVDLITTAARVAGVPQR
ncbi:hypothetical protein GGI12_004660 [Dipsacomyces acuminosporus]|nr:hypothetical protein GGI12_004660 [Dipsacomyces acuminosporus]